MIKLFLHCHFIKIHLNINYLLIKIIIKIKDKIIFYLETIINIINKIIEKTPIYYLIYY